MSQAASCSPAPPTLPGQLDLAFWQKDFLAAVEELRLSRQRLASAEEEIAGLKVERSSLHAALGVARAELEQREELHASAIDEVKKESLEVIAQHRHQTETYRCAAQAREEECKSLKREARETQRENEHLQQQVKELQARVEQQIHLNKTTTSEASKGEHARQQLVKQMEELRGQHLRLETVAKKATQDGLALQDGVLGIEGTLTRIKQERDQLHREVVRLRAASHHEVVVSRANDTSGVHLKCEEELAGLRKQLQDESTERKRLFQALSEANTAAQQFASYSREITDTAQNENTSIPSVT